MLSQSLKSREYPGSSRGRHASYVSKPSRPTESTHCRPEIAPEKQLRSHWICVFSMFLSQSKGDANVCAISSNEQGTLQDLSSTCLGTAGAVRIPIQMLQQVIRRIARVANVHRKLQVTCCASVWHGAGTDRSDGSLVFDVQFVVVLAIMHSFAPVGRCPGISL